MTCAVPARPEGNANPAGVPAHDLDHHHPDVARGCCESCRPHPWQWPRRYRSRMSCRWRIDRGRWSWARPRFSAGGRAHGDSRVDAEFLRMGEDFGGEVAGDVLARFRWSCSTWSRGDCRAWGLKDRAAAGQNADGLPLVLENGRLDRGPDHGAKARGRRRLRYRCECSECCHAYERSSGSNVHETERRLLSNGDRNRCGADATVRGGRA
jgi:hypothetical protein